MGARDARRVEPRPGNADRAAVLWGAVEAEEGAAGSVAWEQQREPLSRATRATSRVDACQRGHALTLDEAVAYALSVDSG